MRKPPRPTGGSIRRSALWVPLLVLSALIIWMYHILAHKPGGQPIGALEWFFAGIAKRIRGMMPKLKEA